MKVQHFVVGKLVNDELSKVNGSKSHSTVAKAVESAWDALNRRRLLGNCDVNLAAAEHYMFCRYVCANLGVVGFVAMTTAGFVYDDLKKMGIRYREGKCPTSQPSMEQTIWRDQGCQDGLGDYFGRSKLGSLYAPIIPSGAIKAYPFGVYAA